jgi:CMP-N-acetylneuraminic acid synthetase
MDGVVNETIAVIPARGGSKRIPRKNMVDFLGKPMVAWTIEAALQSGLFGHVLVSTDDAEIARLARQYGAEAPFLRDRACDDHAPVAEATLAALAQAQDHWHERYNTVVQLMPNCPLRGRKETSDALAHFRASGAPFQVSCFRFGWMNPWWAHRMHADGSFEPLFPDAMTRRSQDLDPLYCPTGAIWIGKVEALRQTRSFYGPGHIFHPIDWMAAIDIDDEHDLSMASAAYLVREGRA